MIYGMDLDDGRLMVAAADTLPEFEALVSSAIFKDASRPTSFEMLADPIFSRFRIPPILFGFDGDAARAAFGDEIGLTRLGINRLVDRHDGMLVEMDEVRDLAAIPDGTTIGQLYGLTEDDRWDKRDEVSKEQEKELKRLFDDAKKAGKMSDESFGGDGTKKKIHIRAEAIEALEGKAPGPDYQAMSNDEIAEAMVAAGLSSEAEMGGVTESSVVVDQIGVSVGTDGKITIGDIRAFKGTKDDLSDKDDLKISDNLSPNLYYKVEIGGKSLTEVEAALAGHPAEVSLGQVVAKRDASFGCWYAFTREVYAVGLRDAAILQGWEADSYGARRDGSRIAPKGVEVVDTEAEAEIGPRPWNDRSREIDAMSKEERTKNASEVSGAEFIYTGRTTNEGGTVFHVVPADWFAKSKGLYPEPLGISALLPSDAVEIAPGTYFVKTRNYGLVSYDLGRKGMLESFWLAMYVADEMA